MSIIKGIKEYLSEFPGLSGGIESDFTAEDPVSFAVNPTGDSESMRFLDGSQERLYAFTLAMKQYTNQDTIREDNHDFLQALSRWIGAMDLEGKYPQINEGTVIEIGSSNPILMEAEPAGDAGLYQIQIFIKYLQGVK